MSTNSSLLQVGSMDVLIVRKPIKNLHLSVLPPLGKVRVSAPLGMNDDAIRMLLATRIAWINRQRGRFAVQERQSRREYVTGESHYFLGQRYRLEVIYEDKPSRVSVKGKKTIFLYVRPGSSRIRREQVLMDWYRSELKTVVAGLLPKWQEKIGVRAPSWALKRMKTRWGTCSQKVGKIWLNVELAKKPIVCTEYIIVHELLHLIEKKHNQKFVDLMTKYLPQWRTVKEELNRFPLAHEEWKY